MRDGLELEQLFVRHRAGRIEGLLVLEDPSGARHRETMPLPFEQGADAVAALGRILARRGDVVGAPRLRVREERARSLVERREWIETFRRAFDDERDEDR